MTISYTAPSSADIAVKEGPVQVRSKSQKQVRREEKEIKVRSYTMNGGPGRYCPFTNLK
jgi:hypothetical protein